MCSASAFPIQNPCARVSASPASAAGPVSCSRSSALPPSVDHRAGWITVAALSLLIGLPLAGQQDSYDLLLTGGHVIDPANGVDDVRDVAIRSGRIARVAANIPPQSARRTVDVKGLYVVPGLVDIHSHVYGYSGALFPDDVALPAGTTTVADAGGPGWRNFEDYREKILRRAKTRVLTFINIVGLGMGGDENDVEDMDPQATAKKILEYPDLIVGIKNAHFDRPGWISVERAVEAGRLSNRPVMLDNNILSWMGRDTRTKVLEKMRPGDLHTHFYNDRHLELLDRRTGQIHPFMREARQRGVLFDLGHGGGSFLWPVADRAMKLGFPPDTISTDIHSSSILGTQSDMPNCMSKMLTLGMELKDLVYRSTVAPARAINHFPEIGTLGEGRDADIAVLALEDGVFAYHDAWEMKSMAPGRIANVLTVRGDRVRPRRPGVSSGVGYRIRYQIGYRIRPGIAYRIRPRFRPHLRPAAAERPRHRSIDRPKRALRHRHRWRAHRAHRGRPAGAPGQSDGGRQRVLRDARPDRSSCVREFAGRLSRGRSEDQLAQRQSRSQRAPSWRYDRRRRRQHRLEELRVIQAAGRRPFTRPCARVSEHRLQRDARRAGRGRSRRPPGRQGRRDGPPSPRHDRRNPESPFEGCRYRRRRAEHPRRRIDGRRGAGGIPGERRVRVRIGPGTNPRRRSDHAHVRTHDSVARFERQSVHRSHRRAEAWSSVRSWTRHARLLVPQRRPCGAKGIPSRRPVDRHGQDQSLAASSRHDDDTFEVAEHGREDRGSGRTGYDARRPCDQAPRTGDAPRGRARRRCGHRDADRTLRIPGRRRERAAGRSAAARRAHHPQGSGGLGQRRPEPHGLVEGRTICELPIEQVDRITEECPRCES